MVSFIFEVNVNKNKLSDVALVNVHINGTCTYTHTHTQPACQLLKTSVENSCGQKVTPEQQATFLDSVAKYVRCQLQCRY